MSSSEKRLSQENKTRIGMHCATKSIYPISNDATGTTKSEGIFYGRNAGYNMDTRRENEQANFTSNESHMASMNYFVDSSFPRNGMSYPHNQNRGLAGGPNAIAQHREHKQEVCRDPVPATNFKDVASYSYSHCETNFSSQAEAMHAQFPPVYEAPASSWPPNNETSQRGEELYPLSSNMVNMPSPEFGWRAHPTFSFGERRQKDDYRHSHPNKKRTHHQPTHASSGFFRRPSDEDCPHSSTHSIQKTNRTNASAAADTTLAQHSVGPPHPKVKMQHYRAQPTVEETSLDSFIDEICSEINKPEGVKEVHEEEITSYQPGNIPRKELAFSRKPQDFEQLSSTMYQQVDDVASNSSTKLPGLFVHHQMREDSAGLEDVTKHLFTDGRSFSSSAEESNHKQYDDLKKRQEQDEEVPPTKTCEREVNLEKRTFHDFEPNYIAIHSKKSFKQEKYDCIHKDHQYKADPMHHQQNNNISKTQSDLIDHQDRNNSKIQSDLLDEADDPSSELFSLIMDEDISWRNKERQEESEVDKKEKTRDLSTFDKRFRELISFKAKHGHCNVPLQYKENIALSRWCCQMKCALRQQQKGRKTRYKLSEDRLERLERIGFNLKDINSITFDQRCREFINFQKKYGHSNVPKRFKENPSLGRWCGNVRTAYNKLQRGERTSYNLSRERILLLEEIGFKWKST